MWKCYLHAFCFENKKRAEAFSLALLKATAANETLAQMASSFEIVDQQDGFLIEFEAFFPGEEGDAVATTDLLTDIFCDIPESRGYGSSAGYARMDYPFPV